MHKIISFIIVPMFFIFIIWLIVFSTQYPVSQLSNYHLDLKTMLSRFGMFNGLSDGFQNTFKSFLDTMKKLSTSDFVGDLLNNMPGGTSNGWLIVFNGLESIFNPLKAIAYPIVVFGYLLALVVQLVQIITVVATAIFDFIFSPIFIHKLY